MATPYTDVYNVYFQKMKDYELANLDEEDMMEILEGYLKSAVVKFRFCRTDLLDRDNEKKQFNEDLTDEEIEILASLMLVERLTPLVYAQEFLTESLSSRDYNTFSKANLFKEVKSVRKDAKLEAQQLMTAYSYGGDLTELR